MQPERPSFNDAISIWDFNDVISIWDLSAHFLIDRAHASAPTYINSCFLFIIAQRYVRIIFNSAGYTEPCQDFEVFDYREH